MKHDDSVTLVTHEGREKWAYTCTTCDVRSAPIKKRQAERVLRVHRGVMSDRDRKKMNRVRSARRQGLNNITAIRSARSRGGWMQFHVGYDNGFSVSGRG